MKCFLVSLAMAGTFAAPVAAKSVYWNVFNFEGEDSAAANFVTYDTLDDMLTDSNRTSVTAPNGPSNSEANIVGSGSDGSTFWNVFNFEGEASAAANFVTYGSLTDMLSDTNRTGVTAPDGPGNSEANIVGSGSDGTTYWNVFNFEGEDSAAANFVTYGSLTDMLTDTNRTSVTAPDGPGNSEANIIGSGSDGNLYWNLFNFEGEDSAAANFVTYATLDDMLFDTNRLSVFTPDGPGNSEANIIGSGAFFVPDPPEIPVPATLPLLATAISGMMLLRRRSGASRPA
ncbi:MAG: PEP-CTERM sorting domain-containing protein [Pseudooceanicola sp.]